MHRPGCDRHRHANSNAGDCAVTGGDTNRNAGGDPSVPSITVQAVAGMRAAADCEDAMRKAQQVRDKIEALATRQQMFCDFAKLALGQRDHVAAMMLIKDAMLIDVDIRRQVNRLGPVELIGRT